MVTRKGMIFVENESVLKQLLETFNLCNLILACCNFPIVVVDIVRTIKVVFICRYYRKHVMSFFNFELKLAQS